MFYLLTKGSHAVEFAIRWGKSIFVGRHGRSSRHNFRLCDLKQDLKCEFFSLRVQCSGAMIGLLLMFIRSGSRQGKHSVRSVHLCRAIPDTDKQKQKCEYQSHLVHMCSPYGVALSYRPTIRILQVKADFKARSICE